MAWKLFVFQTNLHGKRHVSELHFAYFNVCVEKVSNVSIKYDLKIALQNS